MAKRKVLSIPCIKIVQPIGEYYIGKIKFTDLCEITKTDIRRLEGEKGFETYLGIQRPRNVKRVKDIANYITTIDACFPTAIILSISGQCNER
jgi:DGQHR domain-containing protein